CTTRASVAGSPTTATSTGRSCVQPSRGSMPMSSGGHVASSSGCATRPKAEEIGLTGSADPTRHSSPIGRYVMATAEHREPCDSRGSCTVLGAPGGEIPPGDSTLRLPGARFPQVDVGGAGLARVVALDQVAAQRARLRLGRCHPDLVEARVTRARGAGSHSPTLCLCKHPDSRLAPPLLR